MVVMALFVTVVASLAPEAAGARPVGAARPTRSGRRSLGPVSSAGPDQDVASLSTVTLDGSASVGGGTETLAWAQTDGPTIQLSDVTADAPTFVAPVGPVTLTFQLTVTEGALTSTDDVTVTVRPLADHFTDAEFVAAQYQDFLGRLPTDAELQAKVDQLLAGTTTRLQLVEDMLADPEFAGPLEGAVQAYEAAFGRMPDRDGLRWWVAQRRHGATVADLADDLMSSHEYATHDELLTDQEYVTELYENVLGRPADPVGLAYWTRKIGEPTEASRSLCRGYTRPCTPCSRATTITYNSAYCRRRRRHRRRQAAMTMAYSSQGANHFAPLVLLEHADLAMLHVAAPYAMLVQEVNVWGSSPDDALTNLLLSASYGSAHGW